MLNKKSGPPFRPNLKTSNFSPEVMKIPIEIDSTEGNFIESFDFVSDTQEKTCWNMTEILTSESNIFSERASTETEDTFNSLNVARSLDVSTSNPKSFENTESFTLSNTQDIHELNQKNGNIKSLSPNRSHISYIKAAFDSVANMPNIFIEDLKKYQNFESFNLQIPNFTTDVSKMQEFVRKRICKNNLS